jgi:hypothetical protein
MPQFPEVTERFRQFIEQQKIFFVGTAARDGRVNIAPKGIAYGCSGRSASCG